MKPGVATSASVALVLGLATFSGVRPARAQQWLMGGSLQVGSGVEGGGWQSKLSVRRARTSIHVGLDFRVDETPKDVFGGDVVAEIEPHVSFGGDAYYAHALSPKFRLFAGAAGFVAPETLLGPTFGFFSYKSLGSETSLSLSPAMTFFVVGSDLPSNRLIFQALLRVGLHVDL